LRATLVHRNHEFERQDDHGNPQRTHYSQPCRPHYQRPGDAELFFVQATIESASALGDSISELREQLSANEAGGEREELVSFLKRTRDQLVEPYTTRYRFFRDLVQDEDKDAA
jgi:hypothetical protein